MYKRGEKSGAAFRRRWCVLWRDQHAKGTAGSHGLLTYYDKPKDSEPKGAVVLKDCYVLVGGITEGASKTDYCELRLMFRNGRTYIWSCEKQEDSFAWAVSADRFSHHMHSCPLPRVMPTALLRLTRVAV